MPLSSFNASARRPWTLKAAAAAATLALLGTVANAQGNTYSWFSGDYLLNSLPSALTSSDTLNIVSTFDKYMTDATLDNQGVVNWTKGSITFSNSAVNNPGLWKSSGGHMYNALGSQSVFNNTGLFRATSTGVTQVDIGFVNSGTVDSTAGFLFFTSARFLDGSQLTGAGYIGVSGNSNFSGRINAANLSLSGATVTGDNVKLSGTTRWYGGTLAGSWEFTSGHLLTIEADGSSLLSNASVTNNGTMTLQGAGALRLTSSSIINNGRFELLTDVSLRLGTIPFIYSSFANRGLLVKSGGSGLSDISQLDIQNNSEGIIEVQSGTLRLPNSFFNIGAIQGDGAIATSELVNVGHVKPGAAGIGTLTLQGNYVSMGDGSVDIGLNTLESHGLLSVQGNVQVFSGILALSCVDSCSFAIGEEIEVLNYSGTRSGTFESVTLDGFATGAFSTIYDDANHRISLLVTEAVTAAVPEPATWALWLGSLGVGGLLMRRRRRH